MNEKIPIITLAIVVIVAIIGLVILINASKTGMGGIYITRDYNVVQSGRAFAAGTKPDLINQGASTDIKTVATEGLGTGLGIGGTNKRFCKSNTCMLNECYPMVNGQFLIDPATGDILIGSYWNKDAVTRAGSLGQLDRCYPGNESGRPVNSAQTDETVGDLLCCATVGNTPKPSSLGGTAAGAAYTYKPALRTYR